MQLSSERFLSLDVFRGMTVCFMIIVNTGGTGAHVYAPLEHALWHGFTPTDLVFPAFLFAVGNAMSFSLLRVQALGDRVFLRKIAKRTFLIFIIGFLLYWFPIFQFDGSGISIIPLSGTRIFGVLQRIALCYCFAALFIHFFSTRNVVIISAVLLIGYWIVLLVFGHPQQPFSLVGNANYYLDKFLLGSNHVYRGEGVPFDPEGILSTLPSIVNVLAGYLTGLYIQKSGKNYETIAKLMLAAMALVFVALCWDLAFPINKKIWTSSFVLLTTGLSILIIAVLLFVIELKIKHNNWWTDFFVVFGKNPLAIYILSQLAATIFFIITVGGEPFYIWINEVLFQVVAPGPLGSLLFALTFMLFCWSVGWVLSKRKIYIRV